MLADTFGNKPGGQSQTDWDTDEEIRVRSTKGKDANSFNFERISVFFNLGSLTGFKNINFQQPRII